MTFNLLNRNIRVIGIFILGITFVSCREKNNQVAGLDYQMDPTLSQKNGDLLDSSKFFLPLFAAIDSAKDNNIDYYAYSIGMDSRFYSYFKAPVLYNYYSDYETYRFLWVRSFHYPVLITMSNKNRPIINTKILISKSFPRTLVYLPEDRPHRPNSGISISTISINEIRRNFPNADSIVFPTYSIKDTTFYLKKDQWNTFKKLLDQSNFWSLNPLTEPRPVADGAEWILEAHTKDKYYFVRRHSPQDSFQACCEYLIKISAAKNEEIY
jgi:hypothetical protein